MSKTKFEKCLSAFTALVLRVDPTCNDQLHVLIIYKGWTTPEGNKNSLLLYKANKKNYTEFKSFSWRALIYQHREPNRSHISSKILILAGKKTVQNNAWGVEHLTVRNTIFWIAFSGAFEIRIGLRVSPRTVTPHARNPIFERPT